MPKRHLIGVATCSFALIGSGLLASVPAAAAPASMLLPATAFATPPVGVDSIRRMNFTWESGQGAYDKATAAYRDFRPADNSWCCRFTP